MEIPQYKLITDEYGHRFQNELNEFVKGYEILAIQFSTAIADHNGRTRMFSALVEYVPKKGGSNG